MQQPLLFGDLHADRRRDAVFFGLRPPRASREAITGIGRALRLTHDLMGHSTPTETLHLSLHKLAPSADEAAWLLIEACRAVDAVRASSFEVRFDRVISFKGQSKRPLVLLPDRAGRDAVIGLWNQIGRALGGAGLPASIRIEPHITLMRTPDALPEQDIPPVCWTVESFDLIWSHFGERRHSQVHQVQLSPARPTPDLQREGVVSRP